jgi:hypothetical protein
LKIRIAALCLALTALAALVFVVPAGAERAAPSAAPPTVVSLSIKPWADGFYGHTPRLGQSCGERQVGFYEMRGSKPEPNDPKVAESTLVDWTHWSEQGADKAGRKYYAELVAKALPDGRQCATGVSDVVTSPSRPKPDPEAPKCGASVLTECRYDFEGTLQATRNCDQANPIRTDSRCSGQVKAPDGKTEDFAMEFWHRSAPEIFESDYGFALDITTGSYGQVVRTELEGSVRDAEDHKGRLEVLQLNPKNGFPTSLLPVRGAPNERGGLLKFTIDQGMLLIDGYLYP